MPPKKVLIKQPTFKEQLTYCCNCICKDCILLRTPNVERKIISNIEVRFD